MNKAINHNDLEEQLNATRIKLYELTKNMTSEEQIAFFNKGAKEILARHGINAKFAETAPVHRQS